MTPHSSPRRSSPGTRTTQEDTHRSTVPPCSVRSVTTRSGHERALARIRAAQWKDRLNIPKPEATTTLRYTVVLKRREDDARTLGPAGLGWGAGRETVGLEPGSTWRLLQASSSWGAI